MNTNADTIFITGGNGYIGKRLVALLSSEFTITVFDCTCPEIKIHGVTYISDNLSNINIYADIVNQHSIIIHLASTSLPNNFNPLKDCENDIANTIQLLQCISKNTKISQFIYFSSGGAIYGPHNSKRIESSLIAPISSYGIVKHTNELYCNLFSKKHGFNLLIARPSNIYGPGIYSLTPQNVISNFLNKIKLHQPIEIWGDGSAKKDYLFIDDFVEALYQIIRKKISGTYNIGYGKSYSIQDIIKTIQASINYNVEIVYLPQKQTDVYNVFLNCNKIHSRINWMPKTTLADGIKKTWEDLQHVR